VWRGRDVHAVREPLVAAASSLCVPERPGRRWQENPTAVSCRVVGRQIEAVPGRTCAWCTLMFGGSPLA